jgi:hypothetical protein
MRCTELNRAPREGQYKEIPPFPFEGKNKIKLMPHLPLQKYTDGEDHASITFAGRENNDIKNFQVSCANPISKTCLLIVPFYKVMAYA